MTFDRLKAALRESYDLVREIGRGGTAVVYLATDIRHNREVALKVLLPELAHTVGPARFLREIEVVGQLTHPHILPLYNSGEADGFLYYVMPYMEGESLSHRLEREGILPVDEAVQITREAADALSYAHDRGLIHRDIKPQNILLEGGHAVIADFGIVRAIAESESEKLTGTGLTLGTPDYMSPEQAMGGDVGPPSDIYALGCVLFEALTGNAPLTGATVQATMARRVSETPPAVSKLRPSVSPHIDQVLKRALALEPADRFKSARAFHDALRAAGDAVRTGASTPVSWEAKPSLRPGKSASNYAWVFGFVATAILLAVTGYGRWFAPDSSSGTIRAVAVLPFEDGTFARDQEHLSDGISDEVRSALSQVPGLRVAARSSSYQFKGQRVGVRDVADQLGVQAVLDGSITAREDSVLVRVELSGGSDGLQLWSNTYRLQRSDVFEIQAEVARQVLEALGVELSEPDGASVYRQPTQDTVAHQLYWQGRFLWSKRTPQELQQAVELYQQAVELDPQFALAFAGMAAAYINLGSYNYRPWPEVLPNARAAATTALELDGALAEAHAALGQVHFHELEWDAAERAYERAIVLNPSYATAHQWKAIFLVLDRRAQEALPAIAEARQLEPLSLTIHVAECWVLHFAKRFGQAVDKCTQALAMESDSWVAHFWRGVANAERQRYAEAIADIERAWELDPSNPDIQAYLAYVLARSGDRGKAFSALEVAVDRGAPMASIARAYWWLDDREQAFAWLERAVKEDFEGLLYLKTWEFDEFRTDDRFPRLLQAIGLE